MLPSPEDERPAAARPITWWELIRDTYLTFDRRTLGLSRIAIGFLLVMDLLRRTPDWQSMYSNVGVLPNHINLWRPQADGFSIFNAFSTPGELWVLWAIGLVAAVCLLVGYRTRIAHVVMLVYVTSMNGRVLLIENGGYVVQNLLVLWTCFLPMGDRFSVDAVLASMRRARETSAMELNDRSDAIDPAKLAPHVTLLGAVLVLQLSAVYFFNVVHKTGPAWHNGTAVHYVLYVDRMVTPWVAAVRDYVPRWIIRLLTTGTLVIEFSIVVFLLMPIARAWARRAVVVLMNALHIGFGSVFVLGPFAWSCCTFSTLMFGSDDWEIAARTMRRPHRARTVLFRRDSGAAVLACRLLKRFDRFELLTFREATNAAPALALQKPSTEEVVTGGRALADVIAALPLGPLISWLPRMPGVRHAVDAIVAHLGPVRTITRSPVAIGHSVSPLAVGARMALATLREVGVAVMLVAAINQALVELWVFRRFHVPQPEAMRVLTHKMRFLQGWFMFSPNPVMDDGTIVVDAETVDGRRIDPFTGKPPNFDLLHAKSLRLNQIWSDYYNRMHLPQNAPFRDAMRDYILRLPSRTGRESDAIVAADIYWVQDLNPKFGLTESTNFEQKKLFSFDTRTGDRMARD